MSSLIVVDKYRCPKFNGTYNKEHKIMQRKGMKVLPVFLERENFQNNGVFYVVDEAATEQLKVDQQANHEKRGQMKSIKSLSKADLIENIVSKSKGKVESVNTKETKPAVNSTEKPKLKDLRVQYPTIKATSVDAFLAEIAKLEAPTERKTNPPIED